jgi:hypothetical protein
MPKKPQLPPQRPQLRLTGSIHTQVYKDGRIIMRKWPRKRPGPGTPAQQANRFLTGWVWWATKFRVSQEVDAANALAPKTLYVPRDLLEMATFGRLIQVNASNGVTWYGVKLLTSQVQALLDQLGTTVGTIITRTGDGWDIILPGDAGQVLTTNGNNKIPYWSDVGGGGGGAGWQLLDRGTATDSMEISSPAVTGDGVLRLLISNLTYASQGQPVLALSEDGVTWPTDLTNSSVVRTQNYSSGSSYNSIMLYRYATQPSSLTNVRLEHTVDGPWGSVGNYISVGRASELEEHIGSARPTTARNYLLFAVKRDGTEIPFSGDYYWLWQPTPQIT